MSLVAVLLPLMAADEPPKPFEDMARSVGLVLRSEYYDADRFHPNVMLDRALRALEGADIGIDVERHPGRIEVRLGDVVEELSAERPASLEDTMAIIDRITAILPQGGFDAKRVRDFQYAMLNGAIGTLDPHTIILPPEPADEFAEEIKGEFFGIGAYLNQEDGIVQIQRVMPGMPAAEADVRDGDLILAVDGEKTVGLSLSQVVRRIKGPKGTTVRLTVERSGVVEPFDIAIVRDLVPFVTMQAFVHAGDIGYVRMDEFNRNTALDLFKNIRKLQREAGGDLRAFVLDLRFNSGGLLDQARLISDFFLSHSKEIVRTVSPNEQTRKFFSSRQVYLEAPMVVLTGPGSASAAEILSGSLQLNDRAAVLGKETFGKGSVQIIRTLVDDSNLKYTTQEYQLRGGLSIQGHGVTPDIALIPHRVLENGSVDLLDYSPRSEGDSEFALIGRNTYENQTAASLFWLREFRTLEQMREHDLSSKRFTPDQQARLVLELVDAAMQGDGLDEEVAAARQTGELRQFMLRRLAEPVAARQVVENEELAQALAAMAEPVTWGAATTIAPEQIGLRFLGPTTVTAGTDAELRFAISNSAAGAAGRLYGLVDADDASPFWEEELIVGQVGGGETVERVMHFQVPPRLYSGAERFTFNLYQAGQLEPVASLPVTVEVEAQPRPRLGYRYALGAEEQADGIVSVGENVTIELTITNDGPGDARETIVYVFKDDDYHLQLSEGRFKLPAIPAGGEVVCEVPIQVLREVSIGSKTSLFDGEPVTLQVRAEEQFPDEIDRRFRATFFHVLDIPVGEPFQPGRVIQPDVRLVEQQVVDGQLHLKAAIQDDNLRYVTIFREEEKVALADPDRLGAGGDFATAVTLEPGLNRIRLLATDADDTSEVVVIRVWGPKESKAEAAAVVPREEPATAEIP